MAHSQLAHSTVVSGFVDSLQEPRTPYISPKRLSQALGVKVAKSIATRCATPRRSDCRAECARW